MATFNYHVALNLVLLLAWILGTRAWTSPESTAIEKKMNPFELRTYCGKKPCLSRFLRSDETLDKRHQKHLYVMPPGLFPGGYGKRSYVNPNPEQATKLLCLITRCKNFPDEAGQGELKRNPDYQEQYNEVQDED